ncbi:putative choline transport protein [Aspergillus clavatus NRRL 1]|uniref:Choline transport protein, putative n=1 Tax=Aspergillus clavatus (strain ATCC 1007 / CBS 513.65 / DSM 816 / NCTC 3887 / NRRL 1 / QM 1276 / 107) TaxID=344612 RepID=A1CHK1_ASPCL|nr:choline transport protein, putative [Aspergillus clavatus NRRL 1]EAW10356.1 choline transport protein, putative [Aspergillus clavatus NRRL 1]
MPTAFAFSRPTTPRASPSLPPPSPWMGSVQVFLVFLIGSVSGRAFEVGRVYYAAAGCVYDEPLHELLAACFWRKIFDAMDEARLEAALGHRQELQRRFDLFSLISIGIVIANSWALSAGTIVAALQNGGPMAILYGLVLVSVFYTLISASLSELASSMPSAGGVYYWASVSSRRYGRPVGFLTGYLNACAWLLSGASVSSLLGNEVVSMYMLLNPGVQWHPWQVFIVFQLLAWLCCGIVCFGNRFIPAMNRVALVFSMSGLFATIMVLVIMPKKHASTVEVWETYYNNTGGWSDGICFLTGLINPAFSVGVPDCISHLSEEVVEPEIKVPQGTMLQMLTAFVTTFLYLIALFYSIQDLDAVFEFNLTSFPTAEIYRQATGSNAGAVGLIAVLFLATFPTLIGVYITGGRMWWSLARDNATPFASYFSHVDSKTRCPLRATVAMASMISCLGCIYIGSTTAFQALLSSFIVLSTLSYLGAILPHVLARRRNIVPGPFYLGRKLGFVVNLAAVVYILVTVVCFCFPLVLPVTIENMNYSSVIAVGLMVLITSWWCIRGRHDYKGPQYNVGAAQTIAIDMQRQRKKPAAS